MGSSKPKPSPPLPFQQQQQQQNTFGRFSISDSPEAEEFLGLPLDFGGSYGGLSTDVSIDPGVERRTDLAAQEEENRVNSAFNAGTPRFFRENMLAKNLRDIRGQGAAEAQQARYAQQMGQRNLEFQKAQLMEGANRDRQMAELERRRLLLPQILQTGGSGSTSGFNTQLVQPQPGFFSSFGSGLGAGLGSALKFPKI